VLENPPLRSGPVFGTSGRRRASSPKTCVQRCGFWAKTGAKTPGITITSSKGENANSQDAWLAIDSYDKSPPILDSNDLTIPPGVNVHSFREDEWHFTSFDHALRIIHDSSNFKPPAMLLLEENQ